MEKLLGDRVLEIWKIFLQSFFQPNRERNPSWRKCFVFGFLIFLWQSFIRQKKLQRDGSRSHIDCCYENKQSVSQTFPGTWLTRVKARFIADIKIVVYELSLKIIYIYIANITNFYFVLLILMKYMIRSIGPSWKKFALLFFSFWNEKSLFKDFINGGQ